MPVLVIGRGDRVVASVVRALQAEGVDAVGVTSDAAAIAHLEASDVTALVIGGGVERKSRETLRRKAEATGVRVIQGALGNRDIRSYVREELVPGLRHS